MKPEKALSFKQPWAHLVALGIKPIENRTWKTNFTGRIYIHASAKYHEDFDHLVNDKQLESMQDNGFLFSGLTYSAIIGEVDIIDCVINHSSIWAEETFIPIEGEGYPQKPIYNWVLANPVMYDKPILNVKGKLSFWNFYPLNP